MDWREWEVVADFESVVVRRWGSGPLAVTVDAFAYDADVMAAWAYVESLGGLWPAEWREPGPVALPASEKTRFVVVGRPDTE